MLTTQPGIRCSVLESNPLPQTPKTPLRRVNFPETKHSSLISSFFFPHSTFKNLSPSAAQRSAFLFARWGAAQFMKFWIKPISSLNLRRWFSLLSDLVPAVGPEETFEGFGDDEKHRRGSGEAFEPTVFITVSESSRLRTRYLICFPIQGSAGQLEQRLGAPSRTPVPGPGFSLHFPVVWDPVLQVPSPVPAYWALMVHCWELLVVC